MLTQTSKNQNRRHVHERIRKKILGTAERPRLNVYRSLNHIYVQLIDDLKGATLVSANSGASAPAKDVMTEFGFTPEKIAAAAKAQVSKWKAA